MNSPIIVGFPLYNGVTLVDFVGATQMFAFASGLYKPIWIAENCNPITTSEEQQVLPAFSFDNCPPIDILFVPGGEANGIISVMNNKSYLNSLNKIAQNATWVGSVCVGSFILASAGLLHNCEATTYWSQIPNLGLLSKKYNLSIAEGYPRYVFNEETKIFTSGGVSSSLDLALAIIERISGIEVAQQCQLSVQYAPKPPLSSGDPSVANQKTINSVLDGQYKDFILPITKEVEKLIHS